RQKKNSRLGTSARTIEKKKKPTPLQSGLPQVQVRRPLVGERIIKVQVIHLNLLNRHDRLVNRARVSPLTRVTYAVSLELSLQAFVTTQAHQDHPHQQNAANSQVQPSEYDSHWLSV